MISRDAACLRIADCGLRIADDSVLSKRHSQPIDLVNDQYSGNAHDVMTGIGLITSYGTAVSSVSLFLLMTEFIFRTLMEKNTYFGERLSLEKNEG